MRISRRIITKTVVSLTAAAAIATTTFGAGHAVAAPQHGASQSVSVNIPSRWLFFADPFPFGVENITATRTAPGILKFSLGPYCASVEDAIRKAPFPRCAGQIDPPANVAWINLSTGARGTVQLKVSGGDPAPPSAVVRTGTGLIAIGGALANLGAPAVATITA